MKPNLFRSIFNKLECAWHVLCGRPLIYRVKIKGPLESIVAEDNFWLIEPVFIYDHFITGQELSKEEQDKIDREIFNSVLLNPKRFGDCP